MNNEIASSTTHLKSGESSPYAKENPALNIIRWSPTRQLFSWAVAKNTIARQQYVEPVAKPLLSYRRKPKIQLSTTLSSVLLMSRLPEVKDTILTEHDSDGLQDDTPEAVTEETVDKIRLWAAEPKHGIFNFLSQVALNLNVSEPCVLQGLSTENNGESSTNKVGSICPFRLQSNDVINYRALDSPSTNSKDQVTYADSLRQPSFTDHFLCEQNNFSEEESIFATENDNMKLKHWLPLDILNADREKASGTDGRCIPFHKYPVPGIIDDFYLTLLDWGSENLVVIAVGSKVLLIDIFQSKQDVLADYEKSETISSVKFTVDSTLIAVGLRSGFIDLWDISARKVINRYKSHNQRVSVIDWNDTTMTSGSRDRSIVLRDIREPIKSFRYLDRHKQEVCGLRWNTDGTILASGGNDNRLSIWANGYDTPQHEFFDHVAAVKGISWQPNHRDILATGGGTADRTIKVWDCKHNKLINSLDTGSQVCNVTWDNTSTRIITTHGYSLNQVSIWNWDGQTVTKNSSFNGHSFRVLFLASNPSRDKIATAAGDEVLKIWGIGEQKMKPPTLLQPNRWR